MDEKKDVNDLIEEATSEIPLNETKSEKVEVVEDDGDNEKVVDDVVDEILEIEEETKVQNNEPEINALSDAEPEVQSEKNPEDEPKIESVANPEIDLKEILEEKTNEETTKSIITSSTVDELDDEYVKKEENAESLVEAALFVAGRFLTMQELVLLTDINQIMILDIIKKLEKKYKNGAIQIVMRNNSYKMDVAQKYHYLINRLASGESEFTKAEQETLAIIAYKQPVKQSVIIKIRGNKSYDHIRKFRNLGLVIAKPVGHTLELELSEEFYEYFNVHQKENQKAS